MDRAEIERKIEELKAERQTFLEQANAQIMFLNGKIAGLEELITPKAVVPEPPKEG